MDAAQMTADAAGLLSCFFFAAAVATVSDFPIMDAAATTAAALSFGFYLSFAAVAAMAAASNLSAYFRYWQSLKDRPKKKVLLHRSVTAVRCNAPFLTSYNSIYQRVSMFFCPVI